MSVRGATRGAPPATAGARRGLLDVKGRARFELAEGVTAPALVQFLERRLRDLDAAAVSTTSEGLAFDVGPSFLRLDLWFRPLDPLCGVSRGRVTLAPHARPLGAFETPRGRARGGGRGCSWGRDRPRAPSRTRRGARRSRM